MLNFYDPRRVCLRGGPNGREWRQRVNLLDFSKFGGVGGLERVRGVNTERLRTPFFADVRYVWNTTIPHKYTPIREEVLAAPRIDVSALPKTGERNLKD
ncbi:hypothetical protein M3Y99_00271600 [Aphelenchoides fujianensis]|nr:hypothetical protein M3Y99_00271600 [Aphelenchoides fujianensis]